MRRLLSIAGALLTIAGLILAVYLSHSHREREAGQEEIQSIRQAFLAERAAYIEALQETAPDDDSAITEFDSVEEAEAFSGSHMELVYELVQGYIEDPLNIATDSREKAANRAQLAEDSGTIAPLEERLDPRGVEQERLLAELRDWLTESEELELFTQSIRHGFLEPVDETTPVFDRRYDFHLLRVRGYLTAKAIAHAQQGDCRRAVEALEAAYILRRYIATDISVEELWSAFRFATSADRALWVLVDEGCFDQEEAHALDADVIVQADAEMLRTAIWRDALETEYGLPSVWGNVGAEGGSLWVAYVLGRQGRGGTEAGRQLIPLVARQPFEVQEELEELMRRPEFQKGMTEYFVELAVWAFQDFRLREMTPQLLNVALALRRHVQQHDHFPESLESLVPDGIEAIPVDPSTGESVQYELTDSGYEIRGADPRTRAPGSRLLWRSHLAAQ